MAKSKTDDGRVSAENMGGKKVPRKAGLKDETTGKGVGTKDVRNVNGPRFNFVRSGG
jgi:hypothetical protein